MDKARSRNYIRKAISHMVPRNKIVEEILDGIGAPGVTGMPDIAFGYDSSLEPYEYSIVLAKNEMRAAGFEYPEDNNPIITPTTFILGIQFWKIISSLTLLGSTIYVIRYRKTKRS